VFTLPQQLGPLVLHQPALIYDALFKSVWHTLQQFGKTAGIHLGMIAVLHTWGQNLSLHPHLHCIVPGGGVGAAASLNDCISFCTYLNYIMYNHSNPQRFKILCNTVYKNMEPFTTLYIGTYCCVLVQGFSTIYLNYKL
jgi:hypothetical protein